MPISPIFHESTPPYQLPIWLQQTLHDSHISHGDLHQYAATSSIHLTGAHKSQKPHNMCNFALLCNVLLTHEHTREK